MKQLLILSGKGGTGKTTTAAAFVHFSNAKAYADCDVDAPNLHILMNNNTKPDSSNFKGSKKAKIEIDKCIGCKKCINYCRFDAIEYKNNKCFVNEYSCEGCSVCTVVCPCGAVDLYDDVAGELKLYNDNRVFSTAELKMGRGNSGMLVNKVKSAMVNASGNIDIAIIDGSPGIGCPVISSVSGVDLVLIVTEPSLSGLSDLKRILKTASILRAKSVVCINKYDTNNNQSCIIENYCIENDIEFVGKIPYDKKVSTAINNGKSIAEINCPARDALKKVYDKVINILKE